MAVQLPQNPKMMDDTFRKLLAFLQDLQQKNIWYSLAHHRDDAIMVLISVPGQRWEVEFLADGTVEAEQFMSNGDIRGEEAVQEMLMRFGNQEVAKR